MLSEAQKLHLHTFGYLPLREVFSPDEAATIRRESEEIFADDVGVKLPDDRHAVQPFFERLPFGSTLVDDDRIYGIGEDLLGPDFYLIGTEGNLHNGDTPWHGPGDWDVEFRSVKIALYMDSLTKENGCLRVVPGSHRKGSPDMLDPLRQRNDDTDFRPFGLLPSEVPSVALESQPGDLLVFSENLLHASFGGAERRHQHAINFMENPDTEKKLEAVMTLYNNARFSLRPSESHVTSDSPRVRRLVSKNLELGLRHHPWHLGRSGSLRRLT